VHLEHDPPRESPTDTPHFAADARILVHVTHFNDLMWDSGRIPTAVIEHGVAVPDDITYSGDLDRGIAVVNNLGRRGRRLGADVLERARAGVPIDLVGLNAEDCGGLGEVPLDRLFAFEARYRFFFNPIRYTSLGLAVCEAMAVGLPVIGLATTEMATVVANGVSGWVDTDVGVLIARMRELLASRALAREWGAAGSQYARERFSIDRFAREWTALLSSL
jgi:glycosyltransferase involved in cell wall biosynthesis